jgi:NADH-quinone oxidoreductase subunit D
VSNIQQIIDTYQVTESKISSFTDGSIVIEINTLNLVEALLKLKSIGYVHLSTIIGYHKDSEIISLYAVSTVNSPEFNSMTLFVQTRIPDTEPTHPSIESIFPTANVYERELVDLLGIVYTDKNRPKLLLPDDFPNDLFPLRKGVTGKELKQILDEKGVGGGKMKELPNNDLNSITKGESSDYTISIGPQHPTHKEPIRFQFFVKGEDIEDVDLRIGFNHRGIEKALEMNNWTQNLYLIERICGICSAAHQLAYTVTAEKIAGIDTSIPDRAQWFRVLIAELERIHSHILWYGVLAHDAGFDMLFHVTWRDREMVMDLLEKISGNRVNYSMMAIGGVRRDIDANLINEILQDLKELRKKVINHKQIMTTERSFIGRLQNVGVLSHHDAIRLNAVGPTARGSGVNFDLRKDFPYVAYKEIPFEKVTRTSGDVFASLEVRLDETIESVDICIYVLENLPKGDIAVEPPRRFPIGQAHTRVEAPRGEDIHYLFSDGKKTPYRHKIRAPTLSNIVSLVERFKQMKVADIPLIIRLIDPCIGCMERVSFIDTVTHQEKIISGQELINRSRKLAGTDKGVKIFG